MVIEFLCPQGHKIRCGDDRAGKPAKCPKCGIRFYVPGPEDSEPSESGSWAMAPAEMSNHPASGSAAALKEQIEFLCPNGHRVWAPISLQGRAGQCPDCGSKFHIPTLADYEEIPLDIVSSEDSVVNLDPLSGLHNQASKSAKGSGTKPWQADATLSAASNNSDGMAAFLAGLISELPEGASVELLTTDGKKYVPEQLAKSLCDSGRLAFSAKTDDDTHALVVLPWPSIARIEVQGLKQLPLEFRQ